jgi:hypothetical protein
LPKNIASVLKSQSLGARLAALGFRMYRYMKKEKAQGRIPIMDPFNPPKVCIEILSIKLEDPEIAQ